jgi:SWI/SNF-related matrix-associated actin-dependent regulator of chromatin subfamily A member 5
MMHRLGYGAWDELKAEIRNHWRFRFDWFFKSRTPQARGAGSCCRAACWQYCMLYTSHSARQDARCQRTAINVFTRTQSCGLVPHPSVQELSRRCETLIRLIEKENEDDDVAAGKKPRGPKKAAGGDSQAPSGTLGMLWWHAI